ncbi:murein biosynthesis integral membrane protein MurJ [Janibacter hoylei]|uniref:murein biosynthesis integral membrane protein MurJ n=1 Tax=Janibacter hoylei TaxID=364298 RepID=UPI0027B8CFC0|nr:lipid II flippase MurJ [Janibacter hoylei]
MSRVARDAGTVAVVTAAARVVGFLRWLVFAWAVGATGVGTVYQTVNTVPNIVYEIAAGGILAAVVVPLVAHRIATVEGAGADRESADDVASALLTRALAVLLPLTLVIGLGAPLISRALLGDLEVDGAVDLGTRLLLLFAPQVLLYGLGIVVSGILQAHRRFLAAALAPLLSSIVVIATYLAWALLVPPGTSPAEVTTGELLLLGGGTTLGVVALSLPLLVVALRAGIRLRPRWQLTPESAHRARELAGAGVVALVAQQVAVLVTLAVANRIGGDGTLVVQNYVQALYLLPYAVLAVPVATAVFPVLAAAADGDPSDGATSTLAAALRAVVVLSGAAAGALVLAAEPIGTVFSAIDRDGGSTALTSMPAAVVAMAPGLVGFGLSAVALRALYARGRALTAGVVMAVGWLVAAGLPVLLLEPGAGPERTLVVLGAASSLGMWAAGAGLVVRVRHDWGRQALQRLTTSLVLAIGVLVVAAAGHVLAADHWPTSTPAAALSGALAAVGLAGATLAVGAAGDPSLRRRAPGMARLAGRRSR